MSDVAIIGAGPYGLSIAAHLNHHTRRFRIFGSPMQTWRERMPAGMRLKSEGFASCLYDPKGEFPLSRFCQERDIPYAPFGLPVDLRVFCEYGMEFQRRYVPMLEPARVAWVGHGPRGFEVRLATGEAAVFGQVVCAVGIEHYAYVPPALASLPASHVSHASAHADLARFAGKTVAVVGGGASAADCAALLAEAGATTHLLTRRPRLGFNDPPRPRTPLARLRGPMTAIGPSWRSLLCTRMPLVFHAMPAGFRLPVVQRHLGPAACWFVREPIERLVTVHTETRVASASVRAGKAVLETEGAGGPAALEVDHVVAATGYRPDLGRLDFLDPALRARVRTVADTPVLSRGFESSVPGLRFVGLTAANAFGPLLRFACGAEFTSRRLVTYLN
ncbi:MAG: NAD(P)/FAD-dependent oxidoreductase [Acetobacteraceae bacterium]|nr:NAD(P)/FAD-dependent oxidoreductase [Acetobacteraceae bacterium]